MKRTSAAAGFPIPVSNIPCNRPDSPATTSWPQPFRFFDLPAEVRNMIYHEAFTPSVSDVNPTKQNTSLRLTYTSHQDPAVHILKRKGDRINVLRPTYFASFALASKRVYNEALPIIARHTTLHLSGGDHDFFCANIHPFSFLGGLLQEVIKYTPHLILEATVLSKSASLQGQLVSNNIFPRLRRVTVHSCGPAEVTYNTLPYALGADDAEELLAKKSWPNPTLQATAGSILDPAGLIYDVETPSGKVPLSDLLGDLRARFTEVQTRGSQSQPKVIEIEVALKLSLKSTITSASKISSVRFDVSEITLDFDSNKITDVTFHKMEKVPKHHRAISTAMAFLDKPVISRVRRRRPATRSNNTVSFQPRP